MSAGGVPASGRANSICLVTYWSSSTPDDPWRELERTVKAAIVAAFSEAIDERSRRLVDVPVIGADHVPHLAAPADARKASSAPSVSRPPPAMAARPGGLHPSTPS